MVKTFLLMWVVVVGYGNLDLFHWWLDDLGL